MKKLKSRKLWMAIGSALASVGTTIAGMNMDNTAVVIIGVICTAASVAIYNICEAFVDSWYVDGENE